LAPALALALLHGCGQTVEVGRDDALSAAGTGGAAGSGTLALGGLAGVMSTAGTVGQAGAPPCEPTLCRGKSYQCGNCSDDDADGLVDALDPDCLGPCDDDELGLSTGLKSTGSGACRQDCYFDGDAGPGNDKCEWSHACDVLSVAPDYPPSGEARCAYGAGMGVDCAGLEQAQAQTCLDACLPLVPNGCDCFGCCELPGGSGQYHFVGVGSGAEGCRRDALDDQMTCPPCTPVPSCLNPCEKCEACVDKPRDPSCNPGSACPSGAAECGPEAPCEFGDYCVTGCCRRAPEPI
jgi:hypothetical protein